VKKEQVASAYQTALNQHTGSTAGIDVGLERFRLTFSDLTHEDLSERIAELYADPLYFDDTVHVAYRRSDLVDYMSRTGQALDDSEVTVHQVVRDGADVFIRWSMRFTSSALGKRIESQSIGMTHLRFNDNGQIVLHQDFWDSGNALYAHLPVVGFFVRRAQGAMQ